MTSLSVPAEAAVESVMSRGVALMLDDISMSEVHAMAAQYDYNGFPVVNRAGCLVGIITKGDLLRAIVTSFTDRGVWAQPVSRWMAHGVLALRPRDSLRAAAEYMVEAGLRSLPVIDAESQVIGVVSRNDLVRAIGQGLARPFADPRKGDAR